MPQQAPCIGLVADIGNLPTANKTTEGESERSPNFVLPLACAPKIPGACLVSVGTLARFAA